MLSNGKSISGIALVILLFSFSTGINAQQQEIDTTEYLPLFYTGALEYNLMIAASKGYASEIIRMAEQGADINAETIEGVTPLVYAVISGKKEAVEAILSRKPELDKLTNGSESALHVAVKNRNFEITEALIRAGADINIRDKHYATPLHYASIYGFSDIVDLLLYYDASIDERTEEGSTPLIAAVRAGFVEVTDILVQNGAAPDARDNEGYTPFIIAAYYGDTLIMDLLHRNGADIYAINNKKHNALNVAITGNHIEAAEYLLRIGKKWSVQKQAIDPYKVAAKYQRKEMIELMNKNNIKGQVNFGIDQISISGSARFGGDFFSGLSLSLKEPYLNGGFTVGFDFKPWYTKVFRSQSETVVYQYLDKSSVAYAGFFKDFPLTNYPEKYNYTVSASLLAGYGFGNKLKGTSVSVENKFIIIPAVALKISKTDYSINLGVEYQKTQFYHNGPLWIRLGLTYNYFFDEIRTKLKHLKWQ